MADFQYRPDLIGQTFQTSILRKPGVEPATSSRTYSVSMINLPRDRVESYLSLLAKSSSLKNSPDDELYYHGTDAASAISILHDGIDLKKSAPNRHFSSGSGFYVTTCSKRAFNRANSNIRQRALGPHGAILIFRINKILRTEQPHLTLSVNTPEDRREWENIVLHFMSGGSVQEIEALKSIKFIQGPAVKSKGKNIEFKLRESNVNQTCIYKEAYAQRFGSLANISFVLFYSLKFTVKVPRTMPPSEPLHVNIQAQVQYLKGAMSHLPVQLFLSSLNSSSLYTSENFIMFFHLLLILQESPCPILNTTTSSAEIRDLILRRIRNTL